MAIPTISEAIDRGEVSIYLAANANSKAALFAGGSLTPRSPVTIAIITDILNWGNEGGAQTAISLRSIANYLVWLCGMYGQQAQYIIQGSGGSSVIPTPPSTLDYYDFNVSASTPLVTGAFLLLIDGTLGNYDFRGYNIAFYRGNNLQSKNNDGVTTCYSWNKNTGLLTLINGAAQLDEPIQIYPML